MSGSRISSERAPFVIVSKKLAADGEVKSSSKVVYMTLCSYMNTETNKCFPSRKAIRERARVSESTLSRALKELEELGYIEIQEVYKKDANGIYTGERGANNYIIKNI